MVVDRAMDLELVAGSQVDLVGQGEKIGPSTVSPYNNDISFRPVAPVDIILRRLVVIVDKTVSKLDKARLHLQKKHPDNKRIVRESRTILSDISADFPRGTLTAILGGSGSGKTTLQVTPQQFLRSIS